MISLTGNHSHTRSVWLPWSKSVRSIIVGDTVLNQDFREFIRSLNDKQVRYLVIGGYAVALHGHPRYTKDLDVWVERSHQNAEKIVKALEQFGFGSLGIRVDDFLVPDQVIQFGNPPNRIDLLVTIPGVDFSVCYESRVQVDIEGVSVDFIDLNNLKRNKQASGRMQDLADLENLK